MTSSNLRWKMGPVIAILGLLAICLRAADTSILSSEIGRASNQSLLWGPYRPNLYFGVRPRIPKSLMTGLLWVNVDDFKDVQQSMFSCH
jgi:mannosyl-oligosaccharide glucosidase